ncbi:MAG: sugar ABC transporter permease YjfF, partial [Tepidisphaeraceae bacterium]
MKVRLDRQKIPFLATLIVCILLYVAAGLLYTGFFSPGNLVNLVNDSAFLGVVAIGMTFVILSGGIDLSVGSVVACTGITVAVLVTKLQWHPAAAIGLALMCGVAVGAFMGALIHFFVLPPFLVTLGGLFFFRGLALLISDHSIRIEHKFFSTLKSISLPLGGGYKLPLPSIIFLGLLIIAVLVALFTRFGRNIYAVGGSEPSALLMGLPMARTKVGVYALSGFCAALGGVVLALYKSAGSAIDVVGLELDAIAAVVVGGTLLT